MDAMKHAAIRRRQRFHEAAGAASTRRRPETRWHVDDEESIFMEERMNVRRLALLAVSVPCLGGCGDGCESAGVCDLGSVTIFAGVPFYEERGEAEVVVRGMLEERVVGVSPDGRDLPFWLGDRPVYAEGEESRVRPYVGQIIGVRGKVVDVGFGQEIWPAAIGCAEDEGDGGE
jgi:hypothetical protein